MSNYTIVWNETKNEGVIFKDYEHDTWGGSSKQDALHASGGKKTNPCSSLGNSFREHYGESKKCTIQQVEIDESKSISRSTFSRKGK